MKPITLQSKIIAGVAIAIAVVVFGLCERHAGEKIGAVDQKLVTNAAAIRTSDKKTAVDSVAAVVDEKVADTAVKKSVAARAPYRAARSKIVLKGDSVFVDGQSLELPSIAAFVNVADSRVATDSTAIAKVVAADTSKSVMISDNRVGIALREDRNGILEKATRPWCSVKCGVAIGVGTTVVVVVIAVKILKAVSHK
jgi:hypothetical protein